MTDLEAQPLPPDADCPDCGGDPEPDPRHNLSALGYLHDDIPFECSDCGRNWTHGVPVGEYDGPLADDLHCDSCESEYGLVHRVVPNDDEVVLHMKCPECYYFWHVERTPGDTGTALVGYPQITGEIDDETDPYGY